MASIDTVVIGAGHAGLALSNTISGLGIEHVVLERARIAERWRTERWDSFTLLTPNWATWLPNWRYDGNDPHGFMGRDEVVSYFNRYARSFNAPVREGVDVQVLEVSDAGGYRLRTSAGEMLARRVVVATGPFQAPRLPSWATRLSPGIAQIHSSAYRSPTTLPDGAVLVVGSGPSGQQIAEDLLRGGRRVFVAVGRHRRVPRRYRGRDYYWWLELGGFYEKTAGAVPIAERRHGVAPALTGFGGGHDLDLRHLHAQGAILLGRAIGAAGGTVQFDDHLRDALEAGDSAYGKFAEWVEARLGRFDGLFEDVEPRVRFPEPPEPPGELDLVAADVSTIVWATGFRPNYASWVHSPMFDADGYPSHHRGATAHPGLYFVGMPWLYRLRSPFIRGAEEDARHVASLLASTGA
jgi:putative flavoprotein involved in K+ transport